MITLQKLKWSNCFSYGPDNELDLSDNTVTQLVGTTFYAVVCLIITVLCPFR